MIKDILEQRFPLYLEKLKELIRIDTHCIGHGIEGGKEKAGQEYLCSLLEKMGAEVQTDPLDEAIIREAIDRYGEGNPDHVYDGRFNVYACFRGEKPKTARSLLFNGHMDTMPAGDPKKWTHSPWDPVVEGDRLYGLGSADMKSGLLAPVLAYDLLQTAGEKIQGDVKIISVADEEGGGNGSIQAAMRGVAADAAVVCEGTDETLILAHMGFVFFNIQTSGRAIHAGNKFLGVNAIEKMEKVMIELRALEHRWLAEYKHPLLPAPSINFGVIQGGTAGSTVADSCTLKICIHYLPEQMDRALIEKEIKAALNRVEQGDEWLCEHPIAVEVYQSGGAFEMDPQHEWPRTVVRAYRKVNGKKLSQLGSPSGCDSRIWRNIAKIPTVQFGPGRLQECHAVNEYVSIRQFKQAILLYAEMIREWCNQESEYEK